METCCVLCPFLTQQCHINITSSLKKMRMEEETLKRKGVLVFRGHASRTVDEMTGNVDFMGSFT